MKIATKITKTSENQYKTTIPISIIEGLNMHRYETKPHYVVWNVNENKVVTAKIVTVGK